MRSSNGIALALIAIATAACGGDIAAPSGAVASIAVTPQSDTIAVGAELPLRATARDANGRPLSGRQIFWASSDGRIATVSDAGVATGVSPGSVQIAASAEGQYAIATLRVTPAGVASLAIDPAAVSLPVGSTVHLEATAYDAQGANVPAASISWSTSNSTVVRVSSGGVVTGVAPGSATVTAATAQATATAAVLVSAIPVASIAITPPSASLEVGRSLQLQATPRDAQGRALTNRVILWSSGNPGIAIVSSSGAVLALGAGTTTISASSEGRNATATITVTSTTSPSPTPPPSPAPPPSPPPPPPPGPQPGPSVASIEVSPAHVSLKKGKTARLTATPRSKDGAVLSGVQVTWSSSDTRVATVNQDGLVTAVGKGEATISASAGGVSGTADVKVK